MILPDLDQRISFSKEAEQIESYTATDMDRLACRSSTNRIRSVKVSPSRAGSRSLAIVDIFQEAEALLRAIESDSFSPKKRSSKSTARKSQAASEECQHPIAAKQPSVVFDKIIVREYSRIAGTEALASGGPSITMGWQYTELPPISVNVFESIRTGRRYGKDLLLGKARREKIAVRFLAEAKQMDLMSPKGSKPILSLKDRLKGILSPQRQ